MRAALVLALLLVPSFASADIAPFPRPRPTPRAQETCIESRVQQEGETCTRCSPRDPSCGRGREENGFVARCNSQDQSYVIYCRARDGAPEPAPTEMTESPAAEEPTPMVANPVAPDPTVTATPPVMTEVPAAMEEAPAAVAEDEGGCGTSPGRGGIPALVLFLLAFVAYRSGARATRL